MIVACKVLCLNACRLGLVGVSVDSDGPLFELQEVEDKFYQRRFARAIWSYQANDFAGVDEEGDLVQYWCS